jgi:uncharacterized membrane protein
MVAVVAERVAGERLAGLDRLRGIAILAMAAYHFSWDLDIFGLAEVPLLTHPFWLAARAVILSSFLLLVGIGQAMAFRAGQPWPRAAWRLAKVGGAAALVTAGSWFAFPATYIFFGVLHHIFVASLLCLGLARLPRPALLALAAGSLALPLAVQSPVFAQGWLLWAGLAPWPPVTNDYVPLFPWLGAVLLGLAWPEPVLALARRLDAGRVLAWAGRHSLVIYLVHQPVLIGLLALWCRVFDVGVPLF